MSSPKTQSMLEEVYQRSSVLESYGYKLGRLLGVGSYGIVRRARSLEHQTYVAVKIVAKYKMPSGYLMKFLAREIQVVKGLKHPNIIRFIQAIETTHRVYIVMECASNGSLLDKIRESRTIKERQARVWFNQIARAVGFCHDRGIAHRDIKCENILFDAGNNAKLSDFGFARDCSQEHMASDLSNTFCGSYAYASPEILMGQAYHPFTADIWSMGIVLFAMLYGSLPFDDKDQRRLINTKNQEGANRKVVFPEQPAISHAGRRLLLKILKRASSRITMHELYVDEWYLGLSDVPTPRQSIDSGTTTVRVTITPKEPEEVPDEKEGSTKNSTST